MFPRRYSPVQEKGVDDYNVIGEYNMIGRDALTRVKKLSVYFTDETLEYQKINLVRVNSNLLSNAVIELTILISFLSEFYYFSLPVR